MYIYSYICTYLSFSFSLSLSLYVYVYVYVYGGLALLQDDGGVLGSCCFSYTITNKNICPGCQVSRPPPLPDGMVLGMTCPIE